MFEQQITKVSAWCLIWHVCPHSLDFYKHTVMHTTTTCNTVITTVCFNTWKMDDRCVCTAKVSVLGQEKISCSTKKAILICLTLHFYAYEWPILMKENVIIKWNIWSWNKWNIKLNEKWNTNSDLLRNKKWNTKVQKKSTEQVSFETHILL